MKSANRETIFVSRKGTASANIDADPAYGAIYEARAVRRRAERRRWARLVAWVVVVGVGVGAYWAGKLIVGR